jgi:hypothetical protein
LIFSSLTGDSEEGTTETKNASTKRAGSQLPDDGDLLEVVTVADRTKQGPVLGGNARLHKTQPPARIEGIFRGFSGSFDV